MKVEEIALRQEIRQMMAESGINRNTIKEMTESVLKEEIEKQVKNILNQTNIDAAIRSKINPYEFRELLRDSVRQEVKEAIKISVNVKAELPATD